MSKKERKEERKKERQICEFEMGLKNVVSAPI